jgi:hypothetical protein
MREQLHTGQQVHYLHWVNGRLYLARVVGMQGDYVALQDGDRAKPFKMHYAVILSEPGDAGFTRNSPNLTNVDRSDRDSNHSSSNRSTPPPEPARRAGFRVGHRVTLIEKQLQPRMSL